MGPGSDRHGNTRDLPGTGIDGHERDPTAAGGQQAKGVWRARLRHDPQPLQPAFNLPSTRTGSLSKAAGLGHFGEHQLITMPPDHGAHRFLV